MKHGDRIFTLACVRDISERKAHTEALEHQALHDDLTGLANRTLFSDLVLAGARVGQAQRRALRRARHRSRRVQAGQRHAWARSWRRSAQAVRRAPDGRVARSRHRCAARRRRVRDPARRTRRPGGGGGGGAGRSSSACAPEFVLDDEAVHVSASIGIALFPEHGSTTAELLRCAEMAMYVAKRSGRWPRGLRRGKGNARQRIISRCCSICASVSTRDELVLHYQPKIDLAHSRDLRRRGVGPLAPSDPGPAATRRLHARRGAHGPDRAGRPAGC